MHLTQTRVDKLAVDIKAIRASAMLTWPTDRLARDAMLAHSLKWLINRLVADHGRDATSIRQAFESDITAEDLTRAKAERERCDAEIAEWRASLAARHARQTAP